MASFGPERQRLQKKAVGRLGALKQSSSEEDYYLDCKRMSISSGLGYNEVRATVWRDLVLGFGTLRSVPYLSETMIVVRRPVTAKTTASTGASARATSSGSKLARDDSTALGCSSSFASTHTGSTPPLAPRKSVSVLSQRVKSDIASGKTASPASRSVTSASSGASPPMHTSASPQNSPVVPTLPASTSTTEPMRLPDNCQPKVVEADIERSLWTLYPETAQRTRMRKQLKTMILRILAFRRDRHYYQGLHELLGFIMYVMTPYVADDVIVSVCEKLLCTRLAAFSEPTLTHSQALLYAMHAVVAEEDPQLAAALEECGVGPESHYAVSWVITWYTHSIKDSDRLGRLVDFFIADEDPWNVILFTASFILAEKERVLGWVDEAKAELGAEADCLMLMARVYAQLVKLPELSLDTMPSSQVDLLMARAAGFRKVYLPLVTEEADNFMRGDVRPLGMLANQRTRNAALRLLWRLLPREWRNPTARRGMQKFAMWTGIVLTATMGVLAARSHMGADQGGA